MGRDTAAHMRGIRKPLPPHAFVEHDTNAEMLWSQDSQGDLLTRNERFFVRSHTRTPRIDSQSYRLLLFGDGLSGHPAREAALRFSLDELRTRPARTLRAVLECTGNARSMFDEQQDMKVPGTPWKTGGVGAAAWTGVPLAHLLREAGLDEGAAEVMATGLDDPYWREGVDYGPVRRPLPIAKALDDCLLAYEMNGEPLPPDHGYPLRLVVPGWVGIASIKWLGSLEVATRPMTSPWNTVWYRMRGGDYPPDAPPLTVSPVRSAFELAWDAHLPAHVGAVLRGRSWSGHAPISRVDVSLDGGGTWRSADLEPAAERYLWSRWSVRWDDPLPGRHELLARASDAAGHIQPFDVPFNDEGYLFWAVVRHPVTVE